MTAEKSEKLRCEDPGRKERQDEPQRIHPDQQESHPAALRASGHQEHACKRRSHAGRPGKAERKSHDQRRERGHGHLLQPERQPVLFPEHPGTAEQAQLIQAEQNDQHTADPRKQHPVFPEETARSRSAQAEDKKCATDPQREAEDAKEKLRLCSSSPGIRLFHLTFNPS